MTVLLDLILERTLDTVVSRLEREPAGTRADVWLFEDARARRAAEQRLARSGIDCRIRSAWKPLLHFFLEEADMTGLASVLVRYPVVPSAPPRRFLLEAHPLHSVLGDDVALAFEPGSGDLAYTVVLTYADGRRRENRVEAPNRPRPDHTATMILAPTGWLRLRRDGDDAPVADHPLSTEFEEIQRSVVEAVGAYPWASVGPYFERLEIEARLPLVSRVVADPAAAAGTGDALHEDLYFSVLELFRKRAGRAAGDRTLRPGQIVPLIADAPIPRVRVTVRPFPRETVEEDEDGQSEPLETMGGPLSPGRIARELAALGGERFTARSAQGRAVDGIYVAGDRAERGSVVITAAQHANETSGVIGVLRAAHRLRHDPDAHFALIALENPDGYALHRELRRSNPGYLLHAARYTALGDDLGHRREEPFLELAARLEARRRTGARLHINLHGYPAHEWTRPLSGYLPPGFEDWSLPKGFFLILDHHPGLKAQAEAFLAALAARLSQFDALMAHNRTQIAGHRLYAGEIPIPIHGGIPCLTVESDRSPFPFTLTTEFPDQSVTGETYRLAHETQMRAVLEAVALYRTSDILNATPDLDT